MAQPSTSMPRFRTTNPTHCRHPIICPSDEPHDGHIHDRVRHFLGCVEIAHRTSYFNLDGPQYEIEYHRMIVKLSKTLGVSTNHVQTLASESTTELMEQWKQTCQDHLRRIQHLREYLRLDPQEKYLVEAVEASYKLWTSSEDYRRGLPVVQAWRNAGKITVTEQFETSQTSGFDHKSLLRSYEPDRYTKARVIHFSRGRPVQAALPGTVPGQYCLVSELLDKNQLNIVSRRYEPDRLKYFHLPSNNMAWVEGVISRYYNEEDPNIDRLGEEKTCSNTILSPETWRGQQLGGTNGLNSPMHPRSMRPLCEPLPQGPSDSSRTNNIVLFMPYLHWETSSNHDTFSKFIQQTNFAYKRSLALRESKERDAARRARALLRAIKKSRPNANTQSSEPIRGRVPSKNIRSVAEIFQILQPVIATEKLKKDSNGRIIVKNPLAQYLMDASRLYSGIQNYRDKKLIQKYLHFDPPMHPRRTLDKAHVLNTRTWRTKDQVVFRATSTNPASFHHYDAVEGKWPDHEGLGIHESCPDCLRNISNTPRLVMVDQLWMWFLDKSTIITSFPTQYGDIKDRQSDVHHAIRNRISRIEGPQIRTVFDVGLIVLDEVFDHLWDPSQALLHRQQPQVINIFSTAISDVRTNQTIALSKFWHWSEIAQENYCRGDVLDLLRIPIQGIAGEGKLLVEIKDILDELDIMMEMTTTQKVVISNFIELAKNTLFNDDIPEDYVRFCRNAEALQSKVSNRLEVLQELHSSALSVQIAIRDTLSLKEQQDGLTQAWRAEVQAREDVNQSRSIMVFTVTSVIFLPLTWVTGIFGMNNRDFADGNNLSLSYQFSVMFPLSLSIIVLTMVVAYSNQARRFTKTLLSLVMVAFRLYRVVAYVTWSCRWLTNQMERQTVGKYRQILQSEREMHLSRVKRRIEAEEGRTRGVSCAVSEKRTWFEGTRRLKRRSTCQDV